MGRIVHMFYQTVRLGVELYGTAIFSLFCSNKIQYFKTLTVDGDDSDMSPSCGHLRDLEPSIPSQVVTFYCFKRVTGRSSTTNTEHYTYKYTRGITLTSAIILKPGNSQSQL